MPTLTPRTKKLLSAFLVTTLVALLGAAGQYAAHLPAELKLAAASIIAGAVHFLNAWGHEERQAEAVLSKATDLAANAVSREALMVAAANSNRNGFRGSRES
ncbi:MAG: hypothetical protein V4739_17435 [Pseudomonadota bacterium]